MEIEKLKVADLRAALGGRGLDTKGTKPILVQRLKVFLEKLTMKHLVVEFLCFNQIIKKFTQRKVE